MSRAPGAPRLQPALIPGVRRLLLALTLAGCGARSDLAVSAGADAGARGPATPEEICVDGGGMWFSDGCDGKLGECAVTVCLDAFGEGCHCPTPQCWDGAHCVSGLDGG